MNLIATHVQINCELFYIAQSSLKQSAATVRLNKATQVFYHMINSFATNSLAVKLKTLC